MVQKGQAGFQSLTFSFRAQSRVRSETADFYTAMLVERNLKEYAGKVNKAVWKEMDRIDRETKRKVRASLNKLEQSFDEEQREALENQYIQDIKDATNRMATAAQQAANRSPSPIGIEPITPSEVGAQPGSEQEFFDNSGKKLEQLRTSKTSPVDDSLGREIISKLNQHSTLVAEKIEQELQGLLPPYITVKSEVSFLSGSLIMVGTVMLLDWVGTMALNAAKEALEEQFGDAVKIVVKRVFTQVLEITNLALFVDPLDKFTITPRPEAQSESPVPIAQAGVSQTPPEARSEKGGMTRINGPAPQIIQWVILILVLVILFNNLFTISLK